ncbi:MAG: SMC-Scp complex subunit ScpB [Porticoccaceae bacterium]|nr:SMC-Scp complex subunit ScpB [Porticoccaceae bacterium]
MDGDQLRKIIEAALLTAGRSLDVAALGRLFADGECPERDLISATLEDIDADSKGRGYELKKTGSGYRFQVRQELAPWIDRLWEEKPKKYSRALLETLALIAYRQPLTRGDIEQVRGVAVSSEIIRTLMEREWIRSVGHRDVPGRPALYATTKKFLDDFNLAGLGELPPLSEIRDIEAFSEELGFGLPAALPGGEAEANIEAVIAEEFADTDESSGPGSSGDHQLLSLSEEELSPESLLPEDLSPEDRAPNNSQLQNTASNDHE